MYTKAFAVAITLLAPLCGQLPVINPGGIVNAATLQTDPQWGTILVGGEIATIFGSNLSETTQSFPEFPYLQTGGVTVDGVAAPLLYPDQSRSGRHRSPERAFPTGLDGRHGR